MKTSGPVARASQNETSPAHGERDSVLQDNLLREQVLSPLLIGLALVYAYLRVAPILPSTLADELIYSAQARLGSLWESSTYVDPGNYLFNFVYSSTLLCGDFFYSCGKLINTGWFGILAVLLYFVAREFVVWQIALGIALITLVSPISLYASVFMPESMFAALVALAAILLWRALIQGHVFRMMIAGASLGLAMLVKPHALMLLPGAMLLIVIFSWRRLGPLKSLGSSSIYFLFFFVARITLGLILGGPRTLNLLGSYAAVIDDQLETAETTVSNTPILERFLEQLARIFATQLSIHLTGFWLAFSLPVFIVLVYLVMGSLRRIELDRHLLVFSATNLIFLFSLIAMSFGFTVLATAEGDDHILRYLARYFEFMFPMLLLNAVAILAQIQPTKLGLIAKVVPTFFIALATTFFSWQYFGGANILYSDSLWSSAALSNYLTWWLAALLPLTLVIAAFFAPKPERLVVAVALAVSLTLGHFGIDQMKVFRGQAITADAAGMFSDDYIGSSFEGRQIGVFANSRFTAASAAFWIEKPHVQVFPVAPGALLDDDDLPLELEWVLTIGEVADSIESEVRVTGVGFQLIKIAKGSSRDAYLSRSSLDSWVKGIEGDYGNVPWGVWLESSPSILYTDPFPQGVKIEITLKVSPKLVGKPLTFTIGSSTRDVIVEHPMEFVVVRLEFDNPGGEETLVISGPNFELPRVKGLSERLEHEMVQDGSLGLVSLRIVGDD